MTITNPTVQPKRQLKLFDTPTQSPTPPKSNNGSAYFSDPSFASNKDQPIHRWVPWIAGFSSNFVKGVLTDYLQHSGTVLDPFSGVGTTLVEAKIHGHKAIGFEINPYAAQVCQAKLDAHQIPLDKLQNEISNFQTFYNHKLATDYKPHSTPPKGFRTRSEFYSPKVLHKVLILLDFIVTIADTQIQSLFLLAFAATMVRYSNYSYEPSLGRRISAGKPEIHDYQVGQTILDKLLEMAEDIDWYKEILPGDPPKSQVFNTSFFEYADHLAPESVDLIISSPPYLNNYHYNRNTRPQLYWLGHAQQPKDLKPLELSNFGKYWQTVREQESLALDFTLTNTDLAERLETLRQRRPEKGIYGGNGWANYAASYFNDCHTFALAIQYVLKPQARAIVVIGNSILQGIMMPTDQYFGKIAESVGLDLVRIDIPRATRVGNSIIQSEVRVVKAKKSHQLYEAIVELRKP